jgi:pimeloyl-ACP methyl ester carboxylesterase
MTTRGYTRCDWGQVHYRAAGDVGPVCVLFHESPLSAAAYEHALPYLGTHLKAYAFDTPGYGMSDPPPNDAFEIPDYAGRLLQAIDNLGIERFAVAGVHTGASIAIEVARQAGTQRVSHAVLTGVPLFSAEERAQWLASWSPPMAPDAQGDHLRWAWERYQRVWGTESDPRILHLGVTQILDVLERYQWAYNAAFRYDPAPALPGLTCPTLLLDAEHDLLAAFDEPAAALLPDARIEILSDLPGQLPIRVPEAYAASVAGFVTEPR